MSADYKAMMDDVKRNIGKPYQMTTGRDNGDREGKTCGECKDYFCHCHVDTQAESMDDPNECGNCGRPFQPNNKSHPRVPPELSRTCRTCGLNSTMANHVECHRPAIVACINASYWRPRPQPQVAPSFPNARDCEHGRQRGKCPECDLLESEADIKHLEEKLFEFTVKYERILAVLGDDELARSVVCNYHTETYGHTAINAYRARVLAEMKKQT